MNCKNPVQLSKVVNAIFKGIHIVEVLLLKQVPEYRVKYIHLFKLMSAADSTSTLPK